MRGRSRTIKPIWPKSIALLLADLYRLAGVVDAERHRPFVEVPAVELVLARAGLVVGVGFEDAARIREGLRADHDHAAERRWIFFALDRPCAEHDAALFERDLMLQMREEPFFPTF